MEETVFETLKRLRDERRAKHIALEFIPYNNLPTSVGGEKLKAELNRLFAEGYIKVHRGINHQLIEIVKEEYSPTK